MKTDNRESCWLGNLTCRQLVKKFKQKKKDFFKCQSWSKPAESAVLGNHRHLAEHRHISDRVLSPCCDRHAKVTPIFFNRKLSTFLLSSCIFSLISGLSPSALGQFSTSLWVALRNRAEMGSGKGEGDNNTESHSWRL